MFSIDLSIWPYLTIPSTYLPTYLSVCLSVCLPAYLPSYIPACLAAYLPTYLPIKQSNYLSTCLQPFELFTINLTFSGLYPKSSSPGWWTAAERHLRQREGEPGPCEVEPRWLVEASVYGGGGAAAAAERPGWQITACLVGWWASWGCSAGSLGGPAREASCLCHFPEACVSSLLEVVHCDNVLAGVIWVKWHMKMCRQVQYEWSHMCEMICENMLDMFGCTLSEMICENMLGCTI